MFSGIVQAQRAILSVRKERSIRRVRIAKPRSWEIAKGQSIAIDGICSTVVAHGGEYFEVEYMPETLSKTTAERFACGTRVNLERPLRYGDYLNGHLTQGHIDCVGEVVKIIPKKNSREITFRLTPTSAASVVSHGSIAINGVSLTVARKHGSLITIALIPYTIRHTNLDTLQIGTRANVELDHSVGLLRVAQHDTVRRNEKDGVRKKR